MKVLSGENLSQLFEIKFMIISNRVLKATRPEKKKSLMLKLIVKKLRRKNEKYNILHCGDVLKTFEKLIY